MNTATFLRQIATASPSFGMPISRRTIAKSAVPLSMAAMASRVPPSWMSGFRRTLERSRASCCVTACTTRASSLFGGPTAMVSVTGWVRMWNAAAATPAHNSMPAMAMSQVCRIIILKR